MNKPLLTLTIVLGSLLSGGNAYAADLLTNPEDSPSAQLEALISQVEAFDWTQDAVKSEGFKKLVYVNINFLKESIHNKIKKAEAHIETYKNNVIESEDEFEQNYWKKKIKSTEKKIGKYNEILTGIDLLLIRIAH